MPPRNTSTAAYRDQFATLTGDELLAAAVNAMQKSTDLVLVRNAISIIADAQEPRYRDDLVAKYDWCDALPHKRDGGGYIRAAIVNALRPISGPDDAPIFQRAMLSYEMDGPFELCGELRAAGLLAMNEIEPEIAASFASRFLHDPQMTYSGEPARTAIAMLATHGNLAPVFGMVSWGQGRGEVIGEGLRSLAELPDGLLPMLVDRFLESEDEQVLLGLFELLLAHRTRETWAETIAQWFRTTTVMDLYGIVAFQIVGSRSEVLIDMLKNVREDEHDRLRQELLDQALTLV